jgi:hypothetical protein
MEANGEAANMTKTQTVERAQPERDVRPVQLRLHWL